METKRPVPGDGHFRWNTGAWFGGQFGCTAWMLPGAVTLVRQAPEVAGVWMACFAAANTIGVWLWRRRDRLRPYVALQALLATCGVSGLLASAALHFLRPGLRMTQQTSMGVGPAEEPRLFLWILGLFIPLMTWFHLMERAARRGRSRSEGRTTA